MSHYALPYLKALSFVMYPSFTLLKEIVAVIVGTRNPFGIIGIALIWTFLAREEQNFASIKAD